MPIVTAPPMGIQVLQEMRELAQIPAAAQRYIRRSLEVSAKSWERLVEISRDESEARSIDRQIELYGRLEAVRSVIPSNDDPFAAAHFTSLAGELAAFDLAQHRIRSFGSFRFLYERLLGAAARPWLLTIFVIAAAAPQIGSTARRELLRSIDDESTSDSHSTIEPCFFPEWVALL